MLRITKLSGEEVASIAVGEVSDVRSLKRRLSQLPGVPSRFRQRLLLNGRELEDAMELDSPMELQLVLLPFTDVARWQANNFVAAARRGSAAEARTTFLPNIGHESRRRSNPLPGVSFIDSFDSL